MLNPDKAREVLAANLRRYNLNIMAAEVMQGQNTPYIMAVLSAMQIAYQAGREPAPKQTA